MFILDFPQTLEMHVIVNACYSNNIAVCVLCGRAKGPGPGLGLRYDSVSGSSWIYCSIFFPINAPGMGRFQLFYLGFLGYGLDVNVFTVFTSFS